MTKTIKPIGENEVLLQGIAERQLSLNTLSKYLSELESQLSLIFAASPDIIVFLDNNGVILKISDAATSIIGYKKEELVGKSMWSFIYKEDLQESKLWFEQTKKSKLVYYTGQQMFVNHWKSKNNTPVKLMWRFSVCDDREHKVIGVASDVTQFGANSVFNLKLLQTAVNSSTDGIIIVDAHNQKIVYSNNAYEKMTGFLKDELLGKRYDFLQTEETNGSRAIKTLDHCLDVGKNCDVLLQYSKKNGEHLYCRVAVSAVKESEVVINYIATYRDITDKMGIKYEWSPNVESGFVHLSLQTYE